MKSFKTVDAFMEAQTQWKELLIQLRNILLSTELEETVKWGIPTYTINGKNVIGMGSFKSYAGIWFFNGALLNDTDAVLINAQEGKTKAMRQWRFTDVSEVHKPQILKYVNEAIENQKRGLEIKPKKKAAIAIPEELQQSFNTNIQLRHAFKALPPYKQREYAEHIGGAKREATRLSRLEKSIPLILQGVGLHDKYKNC